MNFGLRGVTAAAPRGDFGGLRALERLAGQLELGAQYGGICVSLANALVFKLFVLRLFLHSQLLKQRNIFT